MPSLPTNHSVHSWTGAETKLIHAYARDYAAQVANERDALRTGLADAIECIESWGAYATPYFRDKWDLDGDIKRLEAVLEQKPCRD